MSTCSKCGNPMLGPLRVAHQEAIARVHDAGEKANQWLRDNPDKSRLCEEFQDMLQHESQLGTAENTARYASMMEPACYVFRFGHADGTVSDHVVCATETPWGRDP